MSCEAAESVEDAVHDNRMFAERAFYCIANGAGELAHDYKKQRRRLMKLQILVSSLNQEVKSLAEKMNLQADAILINQCNENRYEEWTQDGHRIRCYHLAERGVGLSRNNALLRADADLCLFSDEDIVYDDGAAERIIEGLSLIHI